LSVSFLEVALMRIRAEKTTRNADDLRTLLVGIIMAIVMLVAVEPAHRLRDVYLLERPLVSATVQVIQSHAGPIEVLYDADAVKPVDATWIATLYSAEDKRLATRRGKGAYTPEQDGPKSWSWDAFFATDFGAEAPPVPETAFYICVSYIARTLDTGVSDTTPAFCSEVFKP
jgi:hypothetical protein